jgi:formate hydrogenlyase subunit 4
VFLPWGIATSHAPLNLALAVLLLSVKLLLAGSGLALIETMSAKLRVFRAPEFLATAFLFAVRGLLVRLLLGA